MPPTIKSLERMEMGCGVGDDNKENLKTTADPPPDGADREEKPWTFDKTDGITENNSSTTRNRFQTRSNTTQKLLDVALLMANVSQLKSVLDAEASKYRTPLIGLLISCITLHIISGILLYILLIIEKNEENRQRIHEQETHEQKSRETSGEQENQERNENNSRQRKHHHNQEQKREISRAKSELYNAEQSKTGRNLCETCLQECCQCWKIYKIDAIATMCVLGVTVINIFITVFINDLNK